ncbi:TfpX/TfpZ family type IV pilin accessory protein [Acinetobacter sp. yr461]|uniref:TfpX/TfpZ family type IV pilin accessory protein n=1 Tax=Acinetobacter sp. yr461 TaxID=1761742 RepID=UPI0008ABB610|nr:TfpX/TfpZ family type IV pilin accessory protein [Acinetobacter sp. yr461]SEO76325.1 hypothetical protein SAMN04487817_11449 [Acinetobacter sp. yr461]
MSSRLKFFLVHFSCSLFSALLLLFWVFKVWYPYPLAQALGVTNIVIMIVIIDLIIGPILCFIIYKVEKKTLRFDLSVIIFFQIVAFLFGFYNLSQGRPVWLVYNQGNIDLVQRVEIIKDDMGKALLKFQKIPMFGPEIAAVKTMNLNEMNVNKEKAKAISFIQQPEKYILLKDEYVNIKKNIHNINELYKKNQKKKIDDLLLKYPNAQGWLPLRATTQNMVVLMNIDKAQIMAIVDLKF